MSSEKPHFLARKFQDFQRQSANRAYLCPLCSEEVSFLSEPKLLDHAAISHSASWATSRDSKACKEFLASATSKKKQQHGPRLVPEHSPGMSKPPSNDSMRLNVGDDAKSRSPSSKPVPIPGPRSSVDRKLEDITKLSLYPGPELPISESREANRTPSPPSNPLKRAAAADVGHSDQPIDQGDSQALPPRSRRAKALSGGSFVPKDPEFDRKPAVLGDSGLVNQRNGAQKRLFDPNTDKTALGFNARKFGKADGALASRRVYDPRSHIFRTKKEPHEDIGYDNRNSAHPHHPIIIERPTTSHESPAEHPSYQEHLVDDPEYDTNFEAEPELLLQPETRPISHDQLVVEVKGIYAGLVMVEAKCIDVDDKQSLAAQEKDPSKQSKLTPEQWQALIALHKTLLHEHHDFFLASQHPSASPALSKLAAKYSMPARMWRHGIHAFLEVLRHRLPDSLDHMLAFIYIAYSMMALLYETVPTFEDTWIECLGDLGRYRMAIEDDDIRDREVWSGVARFWYGKAADKSPNVGRLYHHLAILARPYTLQQLSLYTRSLTCIVPFESAKGSIMTLFSPILEGRESAYHRSSSMETLFIKAHGLLFTGGSMQEFNICVQQLSNDLFDTYIGRVTSKFKEQGVFAALSNISSLFEYGILRAKGTSRSTLRLAFEEMLSQRGSANTDRTNPDYNPEGDEAASLALATSSNFEVLTSREQEASLRMISYASSITFETFSIALRRVGDKNVYPLVHVYMAFIYSVTNVEKATTLLQERIPWIEMAQFLTSLAKPETITSRVMSKSFPRPEEGFGRPLPEDFLMRGQLWTESLFPITWFKDAAVDDEERILELPSMAAPRVERLLWLGHRIATCKKWIVYEEDTRAFVTTPYVRDFPLQDIAQEQLSTVSPKDQDSIMEGFDDEDNTSFNVPDSPPARRESSFDLPRSQPNFRSTQKEEIRSKRKPNNPNPRAFTPKKILTKDDVTMTDSTNLKYEAPSPPEFQTTNADSEEWLKGENPARKMSPRKADLDQFDSKPQKLDMVNVLDVSDGKDSTKV